MSFWTALRTALPFHPADAFQQGVAARTSGKRLSDNPHCLASDAHHEWAEGWRATLDLDEDDDLESCRFDRGLAN